MSNEPVSAVLPAEATRRPAFPTERAFQSALFWGIVAVTVFTPPSLEVMGPARPGLAIAVGIGFTVVGALVGFIPVTVDWLNERLRAAGRPCKADDR